jgi:hypothetical protein
VGHLQPFVRLDRVFHLHSFAGFAGHGCQSGTGRMTGYRTALGGV